MPVVITSKVPITVWSSRACEHPRGVEGSMSRRTTCLNDQPRGCSHARTTTPRTAPWSSWLQRIAPRGTPDRPVTTSLPPPALKAPHNLAQGRATGASTRPWVMDGAAPWVRGRQRARDCRFAGDNVHLIADITRPGFAGDNVHVRLPTRNPFFFTVYLRIAKRDTILRRLKFERRTHGMVTTTTTVLFADDVVRSSVRLSSSFPSPGR